MNKNDEQGNEPGHVPNKTMPATPEKPEGSPTPESSPQETLSQGASPSQGAAPQSNAEKEALKAKPTGSPSASPTNEFVDDIKEMVKTKDMTKVNEKYVKPVNEKYVKPAYEVSKQAAIQGWNFIEENTPKVIAAGKEAWAKTSDMIQKMKDKQTAKKTTSTSDSDKSDKSDKNPPTPPVPPAP